MARKMIAALQISLDGYTQGSDQGGEEWVDSWADALELIPDVDTFVQGSGMFPGYGEYWAAIEANPKAVPPFSARPPYPREVSYAERAAKAPHYVLSSKLESVSWPPGAKIVRSIDDLAALKKQAGKNIYVVGGPTLVTALLNADLLDELRLIVHPLLLGGGRSLFEGATKRRVLEFMGSQPASSGRIVLNYRV